jgi:hypothetical protein
MINICCIARLAVMIISMLEVKEKLKTFFECLIRKIYNKCEVSKKTPLFDASVEL